jgi:2-hydroxychromene-2-carboxylate isomerase
MTSPVRWYFDFVSPFSYLQLAYVETLAERERVVLKPILFAGLLDLHGQRGPAEIPQKRAFTYQFAQWRADRMGIPMRFPDSHPFNPLSALRLCVAAGATPESVRAIFDHIWRDGGDPDEKGLAPVATALGVSELESAIAQPSVKAALRANFDEAVADGVFGVPTLVADGHVFWGEDSGSMFEAFRSDPSLFDSAEMRRLSSLPVGLHRRAVR